MNGRYIRTVATGDLTEKAERIPAIGEDVFECPDDNLVMRNADGSLRWKALNNNLTLRSLENDPIAVLALKQKYLDEIPDRMTLCFANGFHTWEEIATAWQNFKANAPSWDTLTKVENAYQNALRFFNGEI